VEVSWRTRNNQVKTARFRRYWQQRELGIRIRQNAGFAVIEMDAFTKPIAAMFTSTLRENLRNVRGIILDFRGNGGGDAEAMTDVASAFLGSGSSLGHFTDRFGSSYAMSTRAKSPLVARAIEQTRVPVVVLASERTSSAAEIFIAALKTAGRARIIGSETCGCVLAIRHRHALPDGGMLDVSEMDYQTPTGQRLERQGIKPDHVVTVGRMDLYAERDRAMEIAISELKKRRAHLN
jgi:carboxyl-terminal processing protease